VPGGVETGERERNAEVVVEVALGGEDLAGRGGEEEREQLLGRGLAGAAGDADDRAGKGAAMGGGDLLESAQRVVDDELGQLERGVGRGDEGGGRAGRLRGGKKTMAVARGGAEGDKDVAGLERTRVDAEAGERARGLSRPSAGRGAGEKLGGEDGHGQSRGRGPAGACGDGARRRLRLMSSRTTWRSSKGVMVSANSW